MSVKKLRAVAFVACLPFLQAHAFDPNTDLHESKVVMEGQCTDNNRTYKCFMLEKDNINYIAVIDSEGILAVYMVKDIKDEYTPSEMQLMWKRLARRKDDV